MKCRISPPPSQSKRAVPAREQHVERSLPKSEKQSSRARVPPEEFKRSVLDHLLYTCVRDREEATAADLYRAMAHTVRDKLVLRWMATQKTYLQRDAKRAYYLSSEFLTGRSLGLCLLNMGLYQEAEKLAAEWKVDLGEVLENEGDPGLGNGGLGRLAACFMDSLATLELPAVGYGIRYDFGIFEQRIEHGQQVEHRDNWLQYGSPWELPRHEHAQTVRLYGTTEMRRDEDGRLSVHWVDTKQVIGLPYDSFIVGHETDNVNTLRLWSARASRDFDLTLFNEGDYRRAVEEKVDVENISKVLYPPITPTKARNCASSSSTSSWPARSRTSCGTSSCSTRTSADFPNLQRFSSTTRTPRSPWRS